MHEIGHEWFAASSFEVEQMLFNLVGLHGGHTTAHKAQHRFRKLERESGRDTIECKQFVVQWFQHQVHKILKLGGEKYT